MLIIIEGADRTGKSTLVRQVTDELRRRAGTVRVDAYHRGVPTQHPLDEYAAPIWLHRANSNYHLVLDRWHLGEVVYPLVTGRPTDQTDGVRLYVELVLRSRGALVVHVDPPQSVVMSRLDRERRAQLPGSDRRWQLAAQADLMPETLALFRHAVATSILPSVAVDGPATPAEVGIIVDRAVQEMRDAAKLNPYRTYVGPPRPASLLLGDTRGPRNGDVLAPAFVPRSGTSGAYLLDAMCRAAQGPTRQVDPIRAAARLREVGVANACDVDHVRSLVETLGNPLVVTLGRNAADAVRELGIDHVELPHPQWVRRFWHGRQLEYGAQVLGLAQPEGLAAWVKKPWQPTTAVETT